MSGLGAWSYGTYKFGMTVPDNRVQHGIDAFKRELIYNGFGDGIVLGNGTFGNITRDQTKKFQQSKSLTADGEIGQTTARYLFAKRCHEINTARNIPGGLTGRLGSLESANDPVAQGFSDPNDEGWGQINAIFHPDITLEQKWDPAFAINWVADQLVAATNHCAGDWDGGVAAYNVGWTYAQDWVADGKPASGKVVNGIDWYSRATEYVNLVKKAKP